MPDRIVTTLSDLREQVVIALLFWAIGASIGISQHLLSNDPFSWRVVVGRALSTGGLAIVAGTVLVPQPDMPLLAQVGVACGIYLAIVFRNHAVYKKLVAEVEARTAPNED